MKQLNTDKIEILFPTSSEDHRLQLVSMNGSIFAILHAPLESDGPINLHCDKWSLVLIAPIKSKSAINISAIDIICLNEISSEEGSVNIHASKRLVTFTDLSKKSKEFSKRADEKCFLFDQEPGSLLFLHRSFNNVVSGVQCKNFSEAQKHFQTGLCILADKMA